MANNYPQVVNNFQYRLDNAWIPCPRINALDVAENNEYQDVLNRFRHRFLYPYEVIEVTPCNSYKKPYCRWLATFSITPEQHFPQNHNRLLLQYLEAQHPANAQIRDFSNTLPCTYAVTYKVRCQHERLDFIKDKALINKWLYMKRENHFMFDNETKPQHIYQ